MSSERTLLERLRKPKVLGSRTLAEDTTEVVRSVLRHLQRMLNSRQSHALAQMDYGIPDPSEVVHNFPDAIAIMQRAIRDSIEKYEPRLGSVDVLHVESEDDLFTLRFQITAQLKTTKDKPHVCFDTLMDSSGRIQVRS